MLLVQGLLPRGIGVRSAKAAGFIAIIAFALVAGLRGMIGTDTAAYTHLVRVTMSGAQLFIEPGFLLFVDVASLFTDNPSVIINLHSVLFYAVIAAFTIKATRAELIYLFAYFAPMYFLMYSMNGIRIGLASAFFLLFFQAWMRRNLIGAVICSIVAFSFHFTILLAYVFFFLGCSRRNTLRSLVTQLIVFSAVVAAATMLQDYFFGKINQYSDFGTFSELAGVSVIVKVFVFLAFVGQAPISSRRRYRSTVISVFAVLFALGVAQYSYAGLRFLDIFCWAIPLVFMGSVDHNTSMGRRFSTGLAISGLFGAAAVLRNIWSSTGLGTSPFIPYQFFWQGSF
jgi:hypothetical protein